MLCFCLPVSGCLWLFLVVIKGFLCPVVSRPDGTIYSPLRPEEMLDSPLRYVGWCVVDPVGPVVVGRLVYVCPRFSRCHYCMALLWWIFSLNPVFINAPTSCSVNHVIPHSLNHRPEEKLEEDYTDMMRRKEREARCV